MLKDLTLKQLTMIIVAIVLVAGITIPVGITYLAYEIEEVKTVWRSYQAERGDKSRILERLQAVMGYGGLIHNFKNMVLRRDIEPIKPIHTQLGAAKNLLSQMRSLSIKEEESRALDDIESVLAEYDRAVHVAERLIRQGRTARQIDVLVKVDDAPALAGLTVLRQYNLSQRQQYSSGIGKWILASDIRASLGYGGMIHNFKNYILRYDEQHYDAALININQTYVHIADYRTQGISHSEKIALDDLLRIIRQYEKNLSNAQDLILNGQNIEAIDSIIKIDDQAALNGLNMLDREIYLQLEEKSESVLQSLNAYQSLGASLAMMTIIIATLLLFFTIWIVIYGLSRPISRMSSQMYALIDGDTNIEVANTKLKSEIGSMARAVETFRQDAIKRIQVEDDLGKVNLELETRLAELQVMKEKSDQQVETTIAMADGLAKARDDAFNASQRTEEEKDRANAIINSVSDAIISIGLDSRIITFNYAAEDIFGYRAREVIGRDLTILIPEIHKENHSSYVDKYHQTGESKLIGYRDNMGKRRELPGLRKNGEVFPMEISVSETQVSGKRMYTGVVRDLSQIKIMEKMKRDFVSTVSHELRTPLTSLKGALSLLFSDTLRDKNKAEEMKSLTLRNVERLNSLVNDILDMEKIESGSLAFHFEKTAVDDITEDSIRLNQHYAIQNGVSFELANKLPDAYVNVDTDRIAQVMANLLSNAAKFSYENGVVEIGVHRLDGRLRFSVTDHGSGVPMEFHSILFERFTQAKSGNTRETGGTGLGMTISKAIIEKHGGNIDFTTRQGEGTTFYFDLDES